MDKEHEEMLKEIKRETSPVVIKRKPLDDAQKYQILLKYSQGIPVAEIAESVSRDRKEISNYIQGMLQDMSSIKETNELLQVRCSADLKRVQGSTPTRFLTSDFLSKVDEKAEIYAYYYAHTGDNKFSLEQSGLDQGIAPRVSKQSKDYILRIRGQYLRDIPSIKQYIKEIQDQRIAEYHIEKPQIQMELVNQVEELKEVVQYEPKQRANLLKAIEMLGRTIGAFTDRVEVEEADAKSGLQIILEKAKKEAGYTIEDIDEATEQEGTD